MAAAPPEVTRVQGGARALIGALSISGLEGAGRVTSILPGLKMSAEDPCIRQRERTLFQNVLPQY